MSTVHPDETTLLRWVIGDLPERREVSLKKHAGRCRSCREARDATRRMHEQMAATGDGLAFPPGDPFETRPVAPISTSAAGSRQTVLVAMKEALARLDTEKGRLVSVINDAARDAAKEIELGDAAVRLACAHVLEEAASGDPAKELNTFAEALGERLANSTAVRAGDGEGVVPSEQLRALAFLVVGQWRLFSGALPGAEAQLAEAWRALESFEAPEHVAALVEASESLRRSYLGRPIEGRLLAERALETFERYGLARGLLRARHARAVALYMACKFRDAHREFRAAMDSEVATQLDRARAVSGVAFSLAARGRFHEAAKEYSRVRRRLRGVDSQTEQYLLQAEMKAVLGTAGRWRTRDDGFAGFALPEAGGAFHDRTLATEIVRVGLSAASSDLSADSINITSAHGCHHALLIAVQLTMTKIPSAPVAAERFARALGHAGSLLASDSVGFQDPVSVASVVGEAALLESCALSFLGRCEEAAQRAQAARTLFKSDGEDAFRLAVADYFEGTACCFLRSAACAERLLSAAAAEFRRFGQENWSGKCEGVMATLLMEEGQPETALAMFDRSLSQLDPDRDAVAYGNVLGNRAQAFFLAGQVDAASVAYAAALRHARHFGMTITVFMIRYCLAVIELRKGRVERARTAFENIAADALVEGLSQRVFTAKLRSAECLGRLGRSNEMLAEIRSLRATFKGFDVQYDPGVRELFAEVDAADVTIDLVAHVVEHLEARDRGVRNTYRAYKVLKGGG